MRSREPTAVKCLGSVNGAIAAWVLGLLVSDDSARVAVTCLSNELDNSWLRELAGLSSPTKPEASDPLSWGLDAAGWHVPDKPKAALDYASCVAANRFWRSLLVRGREGDLARASVAVGDDSFHELDTFVYAASEHEERSSDRSFFDKAILAEAPQWADR